MGSWLRDNQSWIWRIARVRIARVRFALVVVMLWSVSGVSVQAEEPENKEPANVSAESKQADPLSTKQEMIRDRYKRFEDRVFRLREQLELTEPANAQRLARVIERAGEAGLSDQLEQLVEALRDPSKMAAAVDNQAKWIADADRLLNILLEQDSDNAERRAELERLKQYQEKLNEILEKELALRQQAGQALNAKRMAQQLDQAVRRIDALLEKQKQLSEQSKQADSDNEALSDRQQQTADETERLAEMLDSLAKEPEAETPDSEAMSKARAQAGEASKDAQSGSESMEGASEQLKSGQKEGAQSKQSDAKKALEEARERLESAKKELEQEADARSQAGEQKKNSKDAKGLSDQMKQDSGSQSQGGQSGGKSGKPTPGQQNLDQAQKEMDGAGDSLDENKPEDATPQQDRAIQELEQARRELENALQQLRQEERAEMLKDLEARFRELLVKQKSINETTTNLDAIGREKFGRAQTLQLADLATQQRELAEKAGVCGHILDEEGTTIVFPRVVDQIAEDMRFVADRLAETDVGAITQRVEAEIVDALEQLLDAVKKMQQENAAGGGQQQGGNSEENSPLLPSSAELKLLKSAQVRINSRTETIEAARRSGKETELGLNQALHSVSSRQKECHDMARDMRDKSKK